MGHVPPPAPYRRSITLEVSGFRLRLRGAIPEVGLRLRRTDVGGLFSATAENKTTTLIAQSGGKKESSNEDCKCGAGATKTCSNFVAQFELSIKKVKQDFLEIKNNYEQE